MRKRISLTKLSFTSKLSQISESLVSPVSPPADPATAGIRLLKTVVNENPGTLPSSVEMQTIARATFGSKADMGELLDVFLSKLGSDSPVLIQKALTVLTFTFKTGSDDFYQMFSKSSKGKWRLKSMLNYVSSTNKDVEDAIRTKAAELVKLCENPKYLESKKEEFRKLRTSFSQPTPRSSFDTSRTSFGEGRRSHSNDLSPTREDILKELKLEDDKPIQPQKETWQGRLRRLTNINEEEE